jgi:hypothetical protein
MGDEYNEDVDESEGGRKRRRTSSRHLKVSEVHSVTCMLSIMSLCWEGIYEDLKTKENEPLKSVCFGK